MTFIPNLYGLVSTNNSGALTPLTISSVSFTGTYELVKDYTSLVISVIIGSLNQVTITVNFATSVAGTSKTTETITVSGPETHIIPIKSDYMQVIITNVTAIASGSVIESLLNTGSMKLPVEPISRTLEGSSDSVVAKSVIHGKTSTNSYVPVKVNSSGVLSNGPLDAFSRLRTSDPFTLFSSSCLTQNDPWQFDTLLSGTGTSTYNQGYPHVIMAVSGAAGTVIRQQHGYTIYQPGKSLLILATGTIIDSAAPSTCTGKIGYFDNVGNKTAAIDDSPTGDGFFFQAVGNGTSSPTMSIIYRTSNRISGTIVQTDTSIAQASWNIDPLNGTGPSGLNVNFTNRQIYFIELEWLGVGDVVLGVFSNREPVPCHKFSFTNGEYAPLGPGSVSYPQLAYMTRGSLPIRYELTSTAGAATMYQVCSSSVSEGGYQQIGRTYSVNNGPLTTAFGGRSTPASTVETIVCALRLNRNTNYPMRPRVKLHITNVSLTCTTNGNIVYKYYYYKSPYTTSDPITITSGTAAWNNGFTSSVNGLELSAAEFFAITTTANVTFTANSATYDVKCVYSGVFSTDQDFTANSFTEPIILSSDIAGNSDLFIVSCSSIGGTAETIYASINWEEYE